MPPQQFKLIYFLCLLNPAISPLQWLTLDKKTHLHQNLHEKTICNLRQRPSKENKKCRSDQILRFNMVGGGGVTSDMGRVRRRWKRRLSWASSVTYLSTPCRLLRRAGVRSARSSLWSSLLPDR
ncbi:hypothetical protein E2C01_023434 [Portunus trituberculatus]|uniref:Secreted protein n=1 Tax=Portunus trituberculatus TaxID=210409 RepID=A0A5B7EA13_PORTR|nr:hypothetical protein [Portunus trituberculatus]